MRRKLIPIIIGTGLLSAVWIVMHLFQASSAEKNTGAATMLTQQTVQALAKAAEGVAGTEGPMLVVVPLAFQKDIPTELVTAFRKAAKHEGLSIAAETEWPPLPGGEERKDPISFSQYVVEQGEMTVQWLMDEAGKKPGIKAVVSLVGEPVATAGDNASRPGLPPVLCVARDSERTAALIRSGIVRMALIPNNKPLCEDPGRHLLDAIYQKVTPKTVDKWRAAQGP